MPLTKEHKQEPRRVAWGCVSTSHRSYWVAFPRQEGNCSLGDRPVFLLSRTLSAVMTLASEWMEENSEIINLGNRQVSGLAF